MAYKGVLPSDLWDRYDCEGGQERAVLDMNVAMEISDKIKEATKQSEKKNDGKGMVARRKQRQQQRQLLSDNEAVDMFKQMGVLPSE
jgi:type IV secretory pathway TraG/TraD family ATPase VirD4|tara:strand:+ start:433 stop:693 length:261 start_codon:yes stop_codon:yes gene_type:complete